MTTNFNLKVEIIKCEDLKPAVRQAHGLPPRGLVIKKIKKNSPLNITYEKVDGGLTKFLTSKLDQCDMSPIVREFREKF